MAFTVEVLFEDLTPTRQRNYDTNGWLAPAAVALKRGTMVSVDTGRTLKQVDDADDPEYLGMLGQNVKNLSGGPISGIRDLVTTDRNFGDTVLVIKGGPGTTIRLGQQNATDKGAGWVVGSAITAGVDIYLTADGGVTDTALNAHQAGNAHTAVSAAADVLEFTFNVTPEDV